DRLSQDVVSAPEESCKGFVVRASDFGRRMNSHAEKNFIRINVANARDDPLVQQDRFHSATMFTQNFSEFPGTEIKCIRSQFVLLQKFVDISEQSDLSKLALIVERQTMVVGKNKQHSRISRGLFVV